VLGVLTPVTACRGAGEAELHGAAQCVQAAMDTAHGALRRVAASKALAPTGAGREVVLSWLSAACYACEARTSGGEKAVLRREHLGRGPSDAFALGVSAVALQFAAPVLDKYESVPQDILGRVAVSHVPQLRHRLGSLWTTRRLAAAPEVPGAAAAADDGTDDSSSPQPDVDGLVALTPNFGEPGAEAPPGFMTECFYLAARAMHVGLLPATYRAQELLQEMWRSFQHTVGEEIRGRPQPDTPAGRMFYGIQTAEDCEMAALLMERPAATATRMLTLVLGVVHAAVAQEDETARRRAAALVPEAMVRSVVNFATFVITSGAPDLFAASKHLHSTMTVRAFRFPYGNCSA
jgi:Ubiquitin elongating factor core